VSAETLKLSSLPLFPLGTVLFPDGVLPLKVFEVRYLDMIQKCHKVGAPFGVVALTQGHEVQRAGAQAEAFHAVGTLAQITALEAPQPGLLLVQCQGKQRFRITQRQRLKHGLWVADVEGMARDQTVPVPDDLKPSATALLKVLGTLQSRAPATTPPPAAPRPEQLSECGWLANRWCELLPLPLDMKQRLMALDNPLVRLELVQDFLVRSGIAPA
jgi:Lon protease-like protein